MNLPRAVSRRHFFHIKVSSMKPESPSKAVAACTDVQQLMPSIHTKWAAPVLSILADRPHRFSELRRALGEVTQKSLTAALRELERDGLITRKVTPIIPPRVDYELTPLAHSLFTPLHALRDWAVEN